MGRVDEPGHPRLHQPAVDLDLHCGLDVIGLPHRVPERRGRFKNTSNRRRACSPSRSPATSPGARSRRIARCTVRRSGARGPPPVASATSSRCNAAAFPRQYARRTRSRSSIRNRSRCVGVVFARRADTHRHTVRSATPTVSAASRTWLLDSTPAESSRANRSAAACRSTRLLSSTTPAASRNRRPAAQPAGHSTTLRKRRPRTQR